MFLLIVALISVGAVHGGSLNKFDSTQRIVQGVDAKEGEFPSLSSIRSVANGKHECGATILTKNWALSAAHCCKRITPDDIVLKSGSIYLNEGGSIHRVEKIISHESFNQTFLYRNDVCLIRVKNPFVFDKNVQQATLSRKDFPLRPGDEVTSAGWGRTGRQNSTLPNRLQKVDTFILTSNAECGRLTGIEMFPGYICVKGGKEGQAACFGDSGGPLLRKGVQIGVTSWAYRPCLYPTPDFYASIPYYIDWIKEKLGPDAADLKFSG